MEKARHFDSRGTLQDDDGNEEICIFNEKKKKTF